MSTGLYGPQQVLLVISNKELGELAQLILERRKLRVAVASTVAEAIASLSEPFDLVLLCLPLPNFNACLFIELVLAVPDLTDRVVVETPFFPLVSTSRNYGSRKHKEKWVGIRTGNEGEREWVKHLLRQCI